MGYSDVKHKIIQTLTGRTSEQKILPSEHQMFALAMLEYIHSVELITGSTLIGTADKDTVPVQSAYAKCTYISAVAYGQSVTFNNFVGEDGEPITYTADRKQSYLLLLLWNKSYWEVTAIPTTVALTAEKVAFMTTIRKTYSTYADMVADTDPIGYDGEKIEPAQLVSVVNTSDTSKNGIYVRTKTGWEYQSNFNFEMVQELGDNPNVVISQKVVTDELNKRPTAQETIVGDPSDFSVADEEGNKVLACSNGHIRTKNFDSSKVQTIKVEGTKLVIE